MSPTTRATDARIVTDRLSYWTADGRALFHDLTLSFGRERTGLVGPNGSGKTTLVRLLAGELVPAAGTIHRSGTISMLPQDFRPPPNATLDVALRVDERLTSLRRMEAGEATPFDLDLVEGEWDLPERVAAMLARFGLDHLPLDRPLGSVSGGEATRLALAGLALGRPDFLLLDEPTNHLDRVSREALYSFVEGWPGGLLVVSHDRELLRRMSRIIEISSLGVRIYGGSYDDYRERRELEDAAAERELDSARAALRLAERKAREVRERQARRAAQGRRDRATANMPKILLNGRRAQAQGTSGRIRAVTEREEEERRARTEAARQHVEERERPRFHLPPTGLPPGRTVLEVEGATVRYPDLAGPVFEGLSLRIVGPERVAVVGPNGSGKSTFLRVVMGEIEAESGIVTRLPRGEYAFLDQSGAGLDPALSVLENFRSRFPEMEITAARHALSRYLFVEDAALQVAGTLSGGERLRAALACVMGGPRPPSLLLLDEPTNHLDLDAVGALEDALRTYDGALLVISHDPDFLEAIGVARHVAME